MVLMVVLGLAGGAFLGWLVTWLAMRRRHGGIIENLEAAIRSHRERRKAVETENVNQRLRIARLEVENDALSRRLQAAGGKAAFPERANGRELARFAANLRRLARLGEERGRLLRGAFKREEAEARRIARLQLRLRRQDLALDALSDALEHAKRAQRSADRRRVESLSASRRQVPPDGAPPHPADDAPLMVAATTAGRPDDVASGDAVPDGGTSNAGTSQIVDVPVDRIVDVPVERVVYREREVRIEMPLAVPREPGPRSPPNGPTPGAPTTPDPAAPSG